MGARPIDLHLKGLGELGVVIKEEHGFIFCNCDEPTGARINLDFPSVGATENIMLAAVFAKGETIISNAAQEPEIVDLQNFLNSMGARISGAGTSDVVISGVSKLHSTEYTVMPDRIVAGTFLTAAAISKGEIHLKNIVKEHLYPITSKLVDIGCKIRMDKNEILLKAPDKIHPIERLMTHPHPGFPNCYKGMWDHK